jgi:hypothetical protein
MPRFSNYPFLATTLSLLSSRAQPRDLRCAIRVPRSYRPTTATNPHGNTNLPVVIPSSRLAESESGEKRQSLYPLQHRRVKSKGAPGLAFETWDPSNQFPLETPTLLFVIRSEAEGSAVPRTSPGNAKYYNSNKIVI